MILILAVLAGVIWGWVRGGQVGELSKLRIRLGWLIIGSLTCQVALMYTPLGLEPQPYNWTGGVMLLSHAALIVVVWFNRHLPGILILGVGLTLNLSVMAANGGWMPVTREAMVQARYAESIEAAPAIGERVFGSKDVVYAPGEARLHLLSDIIALPWPWPAVISLGDVFIAVGAAWLVAKTMHPVQGILPRHRPDTP